MFNLKEVNKNTCILGKIFENSLKTNDFQLFKFLVDNQYDLLYENVKKNCAYKKYREYNKYKNILDMITKKTDNLKFLKYYLSKIGKDKLLRTPKNDYDYGDDDPDTLNNFKVESIIYNRIYKMYRVLELGNYRTIEYMIKHYKKSPLWENKNFKEEIKSFEEQIKYIKQGKIDIVMPIIKEKQRFFKEKYYIPGGRFEEKASVRFDKMKINFGKRKKQPKKLTKALKNKAKKFKIRLTVKRNGKRVYKSKSVLEKQIRLKIKRKTK